jgi:hypothetical protein
MELKRDISVSKLEEALTSPDEYALKALMGAVSGIFTTLLGG